MCSSMHPLRLFKAKCWNVAGLFWWGGGLLLFDTLGNLDPPSVEYLVRFFCYLLTVCRTVGSAGTGPCWEPWSSSLTGWSSPPPPMDGVCNMLKNWLCIPAWLALSSSKGILEHPSAGSDWKSPGPAFWGGQMLSWKHLVRTMKAPFVIIAAYKYRCECLQKRGKFEIQFVPLRPC